MSTSKLNDYQYLKDLATSLALGGKKRRIQVVMPSKLVDMIDKHFPNVDRSALVSQALTEILLHKHRIDNPDLEAWISEEQYNLDEMETYLKAREKDV
ncbi:MAG: hypothetical protein UY18_C0027G0004 [Microgenomates group bacterium GW2011_GWF2_47_9]|nr:MAG: hypothetical protein UY18_C0027G0004 [Microgenomates group bacterium GW2011_GWF2_47_9]